MREKQKSIIIVADTHFGLNHEDESCDPKAFGDFLKWIKSIERGKEEKWLRGTYYLDNNLICTHQAL